jgi:hypothetical protein
MDGFEGDILKYLVAHLQNEVVVLIKFIPAISALPLLSFLKISLPKQDYFNESIFGGRVSTKASLGNKNYQILTFSNVPSCVLLVYASRPLQIHPHKECR